MGQFQGQSLAGELASVPRPTDLRCLADLDCEQPNVGERSVAALLESVRGPLRCVDWLKCLLWAYCVAFWVTAGLVFARFL